MDQHAFWLIQKLSNRWCCIKGKQMWLFRLFTKKTPIQSCFWSNISGILHQITDIRVSISSWGIGLRSGHILSIEDLSKILRRPSSRHWQTHFKFQIQFFDKLRVSETLWTYFTGVNKGVINFYKVFWGLLYNKMAKWLCWPFYAEPSIIQQNS